MGQYTSRIIGDAPDETAHPPSSLQEQHSISSTSESPALSVTSDNSRNLLRIRRRRSSLNHSILPPTRRRRLLRIWGSRPSDAETTESLNEDVTDITDNEDVSNQTQAPNIEGTSGSGNITRAYPHTDTPDASNFIDELDNIASDLFNSISREHRPRVRQYTSWSSLRSDSPDNNHNQHHHHWFSNRRLQNSHMSSDTSAEDIDTTINHNAIPFENQIDMLSRLLEVAATSTVYTLMGSSFANGRRFDNTSTRTSENNINLPDSSSNDSTFQEFIHSLRHGLLNNELSTDLNDSNDAREDRTFFRAFRFDSEDESSLNGNNPSVPVMIVGVRSVNQGSESSDAFVNNYDNEVDLTTEGSLRNRSTQNGRSNSSYSTTSSSTSDESVDNNNNRASTTGSTTQPSNQRSWIIFVMGNTFTWNHPLLSAPSLMSENPTYEDLLNLQELIGQVKPQVVSKDELHKHNDQLFELKLIDEDVNFNKVSNHEILSLSNILERCQICLTDYENHEIVRKLSSCNHFYHKDCVDTWLLKGMNNCPLCRSKGIISNEI